MTAEHTIGTAQLLFDGGRLTLAREYCGLRKTDLARALDVTPGAITQYEQGKTRPSRGVLAAIALQLRFPPEFFESGRPTVEVGEGTTYFRSLRSTTKSRRRQLLAHLQLMGELLAWVEDNVALPDVDVPQLEVPTGREAAAAAAADVRRAWGLGRGPVSNLVKMLEAHGVVVTRPRLATEEVDAFSRWLAERPVVVLSRDKEDGARSRFDAAHELGHLVMHRGAVDHDGAEPGDPELERQAHAFAAEFLMPADAISSELPLRLNWPRYLELKQRWGVSLAALVRRAYDLGVISQYAYERAHVQLSGRGWRRDEPGQIAAEEPTVLARALSLMRSELGVDNRVLAASLRVHEGYVEALWRDIGPAVVERPKVRLP